jgi:hypothetical protein
MSEEKKAQSRKWVNGYTAAGTVIVVAAVIPGMTSAALVTIEGHMCYQIGKIYRGDSYTMQEALLAARIVGLVAVAAPILAMEALNAIPLAGWAVKGGVAATVIKGLGEAIIAHYEKQERQEAIQMPKSVDGIIDVTATDITPASPPTALPFMTSSSIHESNSSGKFMSGRSLVITAMFMRSLIARCFCKLIYAISPTTMSGFHSKCRSQ